MNMQDYQTVTPTTEVVSAIFSGSATDSEIASFKSDPKRAILELGNVDLGSDVSVIVAENGSNDVNLVLPYYSIVDEFQSQLANGLSDSELDSISGGEIFISLCIFGGMFAGMAVGVGVTAGAIGGAVVAGSVAGAAIIGGTAGGIVERRKKQGKK